MKLTADQYYYVYFVCMKSQRCSNHSHIRQNSSVFVSLLCFQLITQASRQKTYKQAVQIYLCQCLAEASSISPSIHSPRAPLFTFCGLTPFLAFLGRGIRLFIIIRLRIFHITTKYKSLCGGECMSKHLA